MRFALAAALQVADGAANTFAATCMLSERWGIDARWFDIDTTVRLP